VPQTHVAIFAFSVQAVVLMGRTAHGDLFARPTAKDRRVAGTMLDRLGIAELAERPHTMISGGERQLVLLARALEQEPQFIVLDEPTANLDFGNQGKVMREIRALASSGLRCSSPPTIPIMRCAPPTAPICCAVESASRGAGATDFDARTAGSALRGAGAHDHGRDRHSVHSGLANSAEQMRPAFEAWIEPGSYKDRSGLAADRGCVQDALHAMMTQTIHSECR
jgi:hypothetical protein